MGLFGRLADHFSGRTSVADPIKHVVVLMFENHSFDQMLGGLCAFDPDIKGVDPHHPRSNKDSAGSEYWQRQHNDPVVSPDPKHELEHILNQLKRTETVDSSRNMRRSTLRRNELPRPSASELWTTSETVTYLSYMN